VIQVGAQRWCCGLHQSYFYRRWSIIHLLTTGLPIHAAETFSDGEPVLLRLQEQRCDNADRRFSAVDSFQDRARVKNASLHARAPACNFFHAAHAASFDNTISCPRTSNVSFMPSDRFRASRTGLGIAI